MLERCCNSMKHYEHMCSLTLNGCNVETVRFQREFECAACEDTAHYHNNICTPNLIGT